MPQSYEIYINGNCLRITEPALFDDTKKTSQFAEVDIQHIIKKFEEYENLPDTNLVAKDAGTAFREVCKLFMIVISAGGIVEDEHGNILLMYRRNFWDLPKGKIEQGEDMADAAIREVQEETGLQDISLEEFLGTTYHAWRMKGRLYLKPTLWYKMRGNSSEKVSPQTEEDIEEVKWVPKEELPKYYPDMHNNLVPLLKKTVGAG